MPDNSTLGEILQKETNIPPFLFPGPIEEMVKAAKAKYGDDPCFLSADERGVSVCLAVAVCMSRII